MLNQPVVLETTLEVTETIEEAIFEVGIAAADGLRILTAFNTDGGRPTIRLEPGIHELRAELEPALLPGEFVLDLGVHERVSGAALDLVERVLQFDVSVSDGEGETYAATIRGYMRAETRWELRRDDGEARYMRLRTPGRRRPSVLFAGQSYYHAWYLSRELRKLGWRADVLNWDLSPDDQGFYHGQDFSFSWDPARPRWHTLRHLAFYLRSLPRYDIFHFSNAHGMRFGTAAPQCGGATHPPVRRDRAPEAAGQEDRLLQQRVPRRRLADLLRIVGRHAGVPRLPVA